MIRRSASNSSHAWRRVPIALALVCCLLPAVAAHAQGLDGTWTRIHHVPPPPPPPPTPPPPPDIEVPNARTSLGLVYDSLRDRMIAFSGDPGPMNDVWSLSMATGSEWEQILPSGTPPAARYGVSAIYDPVADRMIVFGGFGQGNQKNDVWELSLSGTPTWTQIVPAGTPPAPRQDAACVYDPVGQRLVLFGGYAPSIGGFINEAWALSLTGTPTWTQLAPSGTPPSARNVLVYAYDSLRGRMLLSGGFNGGYLADTWALDLAGGGAWAQITTATSPPARREAYGVYDSFRDMLVLFGGYDGSYRGDSWELALGGTPQWSQVFPTGTGPANRGGGDAIHDPVRKRIVIYGGYDGTYPGNVWARSLEPSPAWSLVHAGSPPVPPPPIPATPPTADGVAAPRTSFGMIHDPSRDRMIVFAGDPGPLNDVYALPLAPGSPWSYLTSSTPAPRQRYGPGAMYDPVGDRLVIFGGFDYVNHRNDVWTLDFSGTASWTELTPAGPAPAPRQDAATIYDPAGQRMIIFGGYSPALGGFINEVWALSLTGTPAWIQLSPAGTPPSGRGTMMYAYDSLRGRLLVFGGYDSSGYQSDTWALDLAGGGTWSPIVTSTSPPARRQGYAAYDAARDRFVMFGGFDGAFRGDSWELPLAGTPDWVAVSPAGPAPSDRSGGRAIYDPLRQRLVIYGGYDGTNPRDVRARSLDASPTWSIVHSGAPRITRRRDVVAAYRPVANEVYLFGGLAPSGEKDETWKLALGDSPLEWNLVDVGPVRPSGRHGHRAVWDPVRERMLVYGGFTQDPFGTYASDLWAFVPGPSPHWELIATGGSLPQGRMICGLGYDPVGDRLILFGGHAGDGAPYLNDAHELPLSGPMALQWSPLTTAGAPPSPRWLYGLQYDPLRHRLIVFGGVTQAGRTNEAWSLDLTGTPTWSLMTPSGSAPSARSDHAMVYDPNRDRMVIFGGYDNANFLNGAHALNLSGTPGWVALSPSGTLPSGRDIIQGVYDPLVERMIVYGGWDGVDYLNDTWALQWSSQPTPVLASLVAATAEAGRVELLWQVSGEAPEQVEVERRTSGEEWIPRGSPEPVAEDRLRFEDRDVIAGSRYTYRLRLAAQGEITWTDEVTVDVPSGHRLELAGVRPNPVSGDRLPVEFVLPSSKGGRIDVFDVAGRLVATRDLAGLEPGRHRVTFGDDRAIEPGLYVIRLTAAGRALTTKALVVR